MAFTPLATLGQTTPHYSSPSSSDVTDSSSVRNVRTNYESYSSSYGISGGCTWWCSARSQKVGGYSFSGLGNAANWYNNYTGTKYPKNYYNSIAAGDILCFDDGGLGHVAFVEARSGDSILISEAANSSNHPAWLCVWWVSISSSLANGYHWWWSSESFEGFLRNATSGGGTVDPDNPPEPLPGEQGHWELVTYEKVVTTHYQYNYTSHWNNGRSINGAGDAGLYQGDDGTQDLPMAPSPSQSPNRYNQIWEPINCFTEERTMTYDGTGHPVWSEWTIVDQGSNTVPVGTYAPLPGWNMEWDDEDG